MKALMMEHDDDDDGHLRSLLQDKIEELMRTKEEVNRAKEHATQSWLDSRPLIDELERFKKELEDAEKRSSLTLSSVFELEAELLPINKAIRAKKEKELEASKMINETTLAIDRTRDELEELKAGKHKEHGIRSRQKQTLRLKRQTFRALQLGLRAVRIESQGVGESAGKALHFISISETDDTVQLPEEEYYEMQKREKEESSLAVWRISVAEEQKLAAEESREKAIVRLKEAHLKKRSWKEKKKRLEDEQTEDDRRPGIVKEKGLADEEIEGEKGYKGMKEKEFADEETDSEMGYWGVKQKEIKEFKESMKGFEGAKYEGFIDEGTEAGDLSSLGNEPVNNRPFTSARTPAQRKYGSNSMKQWQSSRSSSRRFTARKNPSLLIFSQMERDEGNLRGLVQEKIEELKRTKEELTRVKDEATQSWLDSRPLIDELERLKQELADAGKQTSMTHSAVSEKEKMEEELKASKMINETILAIDQTRDELEELKAEKHKEHKVRLSMKQNLKLKRQTLRSLKLGLRAARIESEALQASAAKALYYISISDTDDTVQLTEKEYYEMKKREREETSLANWRITVAEDQKLAVEESRANVIMRLKETQSKKGSRRVKEKGLQDEETEAETKTAGNWSSQRNEPISNRQLASAETSALKIYGSNSMRRWQPFRFSSRKCITKIYPSMVGMIRKSCSPIRKLFGLISTEPCRKPQVKHT